MKNCPKCKATYPVDFTHCPKDGLRLADTDAWSPGSIIRGKYRILDIIGEGGMATVYKAEHVHFGEIRALKVMSHELDADPAFVRRFMQEAVVTRRLQHLNAVRVEDVDEDEDGRPFMVMEHIQGRTLQGVMQAEGRMTVARACGLTKQIAQALEAAHKLGMVHRDIKPGNIMLANDGEVVKVLDFGIAKVMEASLVENGLLHSTLTIRGMLVGTPAYMSPEQAMGKRGDELDGRSDIYSLGVVMYEMLAGDVPLKADSELQFRMAHVGTAPLPIRQLRPDIPEALAYLVMSCLEKDRDQRPASAKAFIDVIQDWKRVPDGFQAVTRKSTERVQVSLQQVEIQQPATAQTEADGVTRLRAHPEPPGANAKSDRMDLTVARNAFPLKSSATALSFAFVAMIIVLAVWFKLKSKPDARLSAAATATIEPIPQEHPKPQTEPPELSNPRWSTTYYDYQDDYRAYFTASRLGTPGAKLTVRQASRYRGDEGNRDKGELVHLQIPHAVGGGLTASVWFDDSPMKGMEWISSPDGQTLTLALEPVETEEFLLDLRSRESLHVIYIAKDGAAYQVDIQVGHMPTVSPSSYTKVFSPPAVESALDFPGSFKEVK